MTSPLDPNVTLPPLASTISKDSLKLWLCELTHLLPEQIEDLLAQREQEPLAKPLSKQPR